MPKYGVSLTKDIKSIADRLAEERGIGLSALISLLIFEKEGERVAVCSPGQPKPVGRPRQGAEYKEITRLIDRAERFPVAFRKELAEVEGLYDAMFGAIQARLDKAIEERDGPALEALAQGQVWQEARDSYWEKEEGNEKTGS